MLEPKRLREQLLETAQTLKKRGFELDVAGIQKLEEERKSVQVRLQELQNQRNLLSKQIGLAKGRQEDATNLMNEVKALGDELAQLEQAMTINQAALQEVITRIPNIPDDSVPVGHSEEDNQIMKTWGEQTQFDFPVLDHVALGEKRGEMHFELASKITGARFVVLTGKLARLQRALIAFMMDVHTNQHGYEEVYVPYLVNQASLMGTGQLPKFAEDQFSIEGEQGYCLIPTAEVPVTNFARDEIWLEADLPKKFVAHTPCFRSEAGSYGKDVRGMFRQHQFEKIELVQFTTPTNSAAAHEQLTRDAETILELLQLPYRRMLLCTGDMGFCSRKTYDLEVWLPGQQRYREISSCSQFGDFQARRMSARFRRQPQEKPELLHTLNGSGLAVGRTLIAVMENGQTSASAGNGQIRVPAVLQKYMGAELI